MRCLLRGLQLLATATVLIQYSQAQQITALESPCPVPAPGDCPGSNHYGGGQFGIAIVTLDFDGDGWLDVAVGEVFQNAVWVFLGPDFEHPTWLGFSPSGRFDGCPPAPGTSRFGNYIAAGEIDGLPGDELLVGAPAALGGVGEVHVISSRGGSTRLIPSSPGSTVLGFGTAIATGDFDRDGFTDIAVGAPRTQRFGENNVGTVHVFSTLLGDERVLSNPGLRDGPLDKGHYGAEMVAADADGDGWTDLIIAAPGNPTVEEGNVGAVFLHRSPVVGQADTHQPLPQRIVDPHPVTCELGARVGKALDARHGLLAIGAPRKEPRGGSCVGPGDGQEDNGGAFCFFGGSFRNGIQLRDASPEQDGYFGFNVVLADVVGSPATDLVVASQDDDQLQIWDGTHLVGQPTVFDMPSDAIYWALGSGRGELDQSSETKEEILFGDPRALDCAGRVLIVSFPDTGSAERP